MKILIAEDEEDIRQLLIDTLSSEGYTIMAAEDGLKALELFKNEAPDLGIFDCMMPNLDGMSLMCKIRETSEMPIIFLTARGQEMDKVLALNLGADDYMVKPFSMAELKARIGVQLRKCGKMQKKETIGIEKKKLSCGKITIIPEEGVAYLRGEQLKLNAKEYQLLLFFMENQERMLTKQQLYRAVWKEEYVYDDNTIMVHISRLRNKLEENPKAPQYLVTFKGLGYKLTAGNEGSKMSNV